MHLKESNYIPEITVFYLIDNIASHLNTIKVSKGAKVRNRYNQVPHLDQDTNVKVTNSQFKLILSRRIKDQFDRNSYYFRVTK